MPPDIWPPGVSLHVATDVMTQARGKKTTGSPHNWPIMRALKKIAACLYPIPVKSSIANHKAMRAPAVCLGHMGKFRDVIAKGISQF